MYLEILEVPRQRKRLGPLLAQAVKGRHLPPFLPFLFLIGPEGRREVREGEAAAEHVRVVIAVASVFVGEAEAEKEAAVAVGGGRRQLLQQKTQSTLPQNE